MSRHRRSKGGPKAGQRRQDAFSIKAKAAGFPARSVYKLEEIHRRVRIFRQGQKVLDLGASPGSWTLFAAGQVGKKGSVLGIDLKPPRTTLPVNAEYRIGDVYDETIASLGGPFDVVLSDMAPNTTGARDADMACSYRLFIAALRLAEGTLVPGGKFVGKIFQGEDFEDARAQCRKSFEKVRIIRPKATRDISYELFLVGIGFKKVVVE